MMQEQVNRIDEQILLENSILEVLKYLHLIVPQNIFIENLNYQKANAISIAGFSSQTESILTLVPKLKNVNIIGE